MISCGIDEAGRGPLVGNVVAAAVILNKDAPISGLNDSKKLSAKKRDELYDLIIKYALDYAIGEASCSEIDKHNILNATMLAMQRAVAKLTLIPDKLLIDGNKVPQTNILSEAIVGGDSLIPSISAASILAKVTRDRQMAALDILYPKYGFAKHKGYPTAQHLAVLKRYGVIPEIYRVSFSPIRQMLTS